MQQRQLRLGDILDDYCPRERRVTNHAVVAMVGEDVKQTRCTTCDTEHEYKHARVPRQRRKNEPAALYSQVAAGAPKRVTHDQSATPGPDEPVDIPIDAPEQRQPVAAAPVPAPADDFESDDERGEDDDGAAPQEDGPVHRPLIRATLPRPAGQVPERPIPEFTMRQPAGRPHRFRPRHGGGRGPAQVFGHAGGNAGGGRGGAPRQHGSRPGGHPNRQRSGGRKRSK